VVPATLQETVPVLVLDIRIRFVLGKSVLVYLRSLEVDVLQLHGGGGSNCGHALAGNTARISGLGAGDLVGSRISILWVVNQNAR
jgi:hypothetical protein